MSSGEGNVSKSESAGIGTVRGGASNMEADGQTGGPTPREVIAELEAQNLRLREMYESTVRLAEVIYHRVIAALEARDG